MDMIIEIFAGILLAKLIITLFLIAFRRFGVRELKEITADWVNFMQKGIPIPSDHLKIEHPLRSQPTLIPLNFRYRKPAPTLKD